MKTPFPTFLYSAALVLGLGQAAAVRAQNSFGDGTRSAPAQSAQQPQTPASGPLSPQPQPLPQQPSGPESQTGGFGSAGFGAPPSARSDPQAVAERQDYGVPPTAELHAGEMHGPTPASIPGGQVITTGGVLELLRDGQAPVLLLDVLGGPEMIQGAQYAVPAAQSGSFSDQVQQQFSQYLAQATGGNKQHPLVLYCLSTQCWMSYNAALRAINLGYTNVLWYRGGIEAWKAAGLPVQRAQ